MLVMEKVREILDVQKQIKKQRRQKELELQQEIERIHKRRAKKPEIEPEPEPAQEQKYKLIDPMEALNNIGLRTSKLAHIEIEDWINVLGSRQTSNQDRLSSPQLEQLNLMLDLKVHKKKNGEIIRNRTVGELKKYLERNENS